jgi:hypothetical protein
LDNKKEYDMYKKMLGLATATIIGAGLGAFANSDYNPYAYTNRTTTDAYSRTAWFGQAGGVETIEEDEEGWNCMTMGNGLCGPTYHKVTQELGDSLAEGSDEWPEYAASRDWESCLIEIADTSTIVCPDGFVTTS